MKTDSYLYVVLTAIVINIFNLIIGMTSSYMFDKFIGEDEDRPIWKRRFVNFSFGVAFTILIGKLGVSSIQSSVIETSKDIISDGTKMIDII